MSNSTTNYQPSTTGSPKVAIVCDWLTNMGGAERVIYALHQMFPDAPIYTSTYEPDAMPLFDSAVVHTAWFQKLPKSLRKHQLLTLPRQWYFGHLKLKGFDLVISASGAEAKAVRAPDGLHINICYTPTLYYWIKTDNYLQKSSDGINGLWRLGLKVLMPYVKRWDLQAAHRPDVMYAISTAVQDRIKQIYKRDSEMLYPPVDTARFKNDGRQKRNGFVIFGRQVAHKRFDLAIAACNERRLPLTVIGDGPEHNRLQAMAGPTIQFKTAVSDSELPRLIAAAEAFIFPNEEDFGIVAVEAQAAGTPVIAYRKGGSLDTVIEGVTGEFFDAQTAHSLGQKLEHFNPRKYMISDLVANADKFSDISFRARMKDILSSKLRDKKV